jgi:type IV pilus assembly protein PilM
VDESQRELATNRLLTIIRSGKPSGTARAAETAAAAPSAEPATPVASEPVTAPPAPLTAEAEAPPVGEPGVVARWLRGPKGGSKKAAPPEEAAETEEKPRKARKISLSGLLPKRKPKPEAAEAEAAETEVAPTPVEPEPLKLPKKRRLRKGKRFIALDIGTSSVKLVEVVKRDSEVQLQRAAMRQIPPAIRRNQSALQMFLDKTIRELLPPKQVDKADLHVVLPDQSMQMRTVGLPFVTPKERLNAIKFQIKKDLPFPLEVSEISYTGWNPKVKDRQDVEVLAVDKRALTQRVGMISDAGLMPINVTSFPATAMQLIRGYRRVAPDKGAVALVDIGAAKTTITILGKERLALCRTIATGGDDFTAVLQGLGLGPDSEDLNEVQAENFKKNLGLPPEGDTSAVRVAILMRPVAERISAELARSLELYRRNTAGGDIQKVILIGGGSQMLRLAKFLAKNLGVEVEIGDPIARVALSENADDETRKVVAEAGPALMPALGVALDFARRQNILPEELKSYHKLQGSKRVIAPAAAALLLVLMALYSAELSGLDQMQQQIKSLNEQLKDLAQRRANFMVAKAEFDRINGGLAVRDQDFQAIRIADPRLLDYLRTLSFLVPENIYLEQLRTRFIPEVEEQAVKGAKKEEEELKEPQTIYSILAKQMSPEGKFIGVKRPVFGRVLELNGDVYPQGAITDVQLVDFVFALEKSGYFRDVAVDTVATQENGKVKFTIFCGF